MKIAMIGHKQVPSREGGIEVVVEELATRMVEAGHEVTLYNRWQRGDERSPKLYKGISMRDVPTLRVKGSDAVIYSFLAAVRALFGGYDVVHFHAEGPAGMAWLTRLFRIPTVVTIHGLDWQRGKWGSFASAYLRAAERAAAKFSDGMIVLSEHLKDYFRDTYKKDTVFIRNGVSVRERCAPEEILKLGLEGQDYILFLARIVPEKGIQYLLEAFKAMDTDLKLVIAGGQDHNEYVEKIRKMAAEDSRVIMPGFVHGRLLEELYSNCRLYVLPSDVEGMPLSLLEALSFGAPCLASDIHENRVAPESFLTLFRQGQPDDLRKRMEEMLQTPYSAESRNVQIDWMKKNYSWDSVVDGTLDMYRAMILMKKSTAVQGDERMYYVRSTRRR